MPPPFKKKRDGASLAKHGTPMPQLSDKEVDPKKFLPVWKQEVRTCCRIEIIMKGILGVGFLLMDQVRDEKGRKRLHGAFTGGFSAGYYNTVGSEEGWAPAQFTSSRSNRVQVAEAKPQDYMDAEDVVESKQDLELVTKNDYFGFTANEVGANKNSGDVSNVSNSDDLIAASLGTVLVAPRESVGVRLMRLMGWRDGQGVGPRRKRDTLDPFTMDFLFAPTKIAVTQLADKLDAHGLGYIRPAHLTLTLHPHQLHSTTQSQHHLHPQHSLKRQQTVKLPGGSAFGVGAFEEEDEDIYGNEDGNRFDRSLVDEVVAPPHPTDAAELKFKSPPLPTPDSAASRVFEKRGHDGKLPLEGFSIAATVLSSSAVTLFPAQQPPPSFKPIHRFKDAISSTSTPHVALPPPQPASTQKFQLSHTQRGFLLGEGASQPIDSSAPAPSSINSTSTAHARPPLRPSMTLDQVPMSKTMALAALKGFIPFQTDPAKQHRYKSFLEVKAGLKATDALRESLNPSSTTTTPISQQQQEAEWQEFYKAASIFQPLSISMSSRFTTSNVQVSQSTTGGITTAAELRVSNLTMVEEKVAEAKGTDASNAASLNLFAQGLTRTSKVWLPSRLLCKRFNIANPYPDGPPESADGESGASRSKTDYLPQDVVDALVKDRVDRQMHQSANFNHKMPTTSENFIPTQMDAHVMAAPLDRPLPALATVDVFRSVFGGEDDESDDNL